VLSVPAGGGRMDLFDPRDDAVIGARLPLTSLPTRATRHAPPAEQGIADTVARRLPRRDCAQVFGRPPTKEQRWKPLSFMPCR
jgi:hypothetical protein